MKKIKIGVAGLGGRGTGLLKECVLPREDVEVAGLCEIYDDRLKRAADMTTQSGRPAPMLTDDYRDLLALPEIDAIIVASGWGPHIDIACAAMRAGKYSAVEVGGAYSIDDCWRLVRTHEETGAHCMLLENCCYGRNELMALNMARLGVFGEIVHCQGGYRHDLRSSLVHGRNYGHYRHWEYLLRNCENYPTHELGPIAQLLGINRGNRMLKLNSVASKAVGLRAYAKDEYGPDHDLANTDFAQGDIVTTIIKCAGGQTITLTLDTSLPRPYSRNYSIHGTKAVFNEDNLSLFLDKKDNELDYEWHKRWGNFANYRDEYEHPIWRKYLTENVRGGHEGIDWLVLSDFYASVKNGTPTPIDAYDMAAWMSITCLSEDSVAMGGAPVAIPDFTNGKWIGREQIGVRTID